MTVKIINGVVWPFAIIATILYGLIVNQGFWLNVALALVWWVTVWGIVVVACAVGNGKASQDLRKQLRERPRWRKWLFTAIDVPIAVLLAGHGYGWTFAFFVIQAALSFGAGELAEKGSAGGAVEGADT